MSSSLPALPGVACAKFAFTLPDGRPAMLAVARVTMAAPAHAAIGTAWLSGAEHARSSRFLVDHARADFLAGRVAAKTAAHALIPGLPPPAAWEIVPGEHQRPRLTQVAPNVGVSLAHAGGVGLALVFPDDVRCGIDLELMDRDADEVIATQVAPDEAAWARAGRDDERLRWLLLWTAREAQGKSWGTGLLDPARLLPTEAWVGHKPIWRARLTGDDAHAVCAVVAGGMVIAMVVPALTATDALTAWLIDAAASLS